MQGRQTVRRVASIGIVALALGARAQSAEAPSPVTRVHGIATGLAACWRPPHDDDQVTVRISFTREGAVIGEPRIVFARSSGGRGRRRRACPLHDGGDTRLHAVAFLSSARRGDRGTGPGDSLHRSQPGDHRCPTLMNVALVHLRHSRKSNSRYCLQSSVGPLSFSFCAKRGKENQSTLLPRIETFQRVAPTPLAISSGPSLVKQDRVDNVQLAHVVARRPVSVLHAIGLAIEATMAE